MMNITKKKGVRRLFRVLLILLTMVIVFNEWLFAGALMYARREMLHEGATYSQWYESSIDGFYFMLFVFILHSELTLAVLVLLIRKNRWIKGKLENLRKDQDKKRRESRWKRMPVPYMLALCAVLAVMTWATGYLYMQRNVLLQQEIAAQEWPLAGRYQEIGELRILLTLMVQGCAVSLYMLIRRWKAETYSGKEKDEAQKRTEENKLEASDNVKGGKDEEKPETDRLQIAERAYANKRDLDRMEIAEGVMQIGAYAFKDCSSLREVCIPRSVHTIDRSAFSGCSVLTRVVLPKGLKKLGAGAFEGCSSLKEIDLGNTIETIEYRTFSGCGALESISLPESVKEIKLGAFEGCSQLETIHMPSVCSLGNAALSRCQSLRNVTLPTGLQKIGRACFARCTALEEVEIPRSMKEIPEDAFAGCENLRRIRLHSQLELISRYAFTGCDQLESIEGVELAKFSLAFVHTPAYRAQYPLRKRTGSFPMELTGNQNGKLLRERGYTLFEEDREYYISRPGEDGIVEVSSWSSDDGPDEDGFGREEYYDWWLLDEQLCMIPDIPMWHDYSRLDMRNAEKSWEELRKKAAEIVSQRVTD